MSDEPETLWGYYVGEKFVVLPKIPLRLAGHTSPPFEVVRPDGRVLHIVALDPRQAITQGPTR
jgi:hypothetical protein